MENSLRELKLGLQSSRYCFIIITFFRCFRLTGGIKVAIYFRTKELSFWVQFRPSSLGLQCHKEDRCSNHFYFFSINKTQILDRENIIFVVFYASKYCISINFIAADKRRICTIYCYNKFLEYF